MADVADELGLSAAAVTSLTSRARQGLRRAYLERGLAVVQPAPPRAVLVRDDPAAARDAS